MPAKDPTTGQFLKAADTTANNAAATAVLEPPAPEMEFDPDELEAAIGLLRSKKAAQKAKEEALANAIPGYPKTLYNPRYKWENIAVRRLDAKGKEMVDKDGLPMMSGNFRKFTNGAIVVETPEDEAFVRAACPGRLYERDSDDPLTCRTCQWVTYSQRALIECERSH